MSTEETENTNETEQEEKEEESAKEQVAKIADDFFYDVSEHVSSASVSEDSGLPVDLLTLSHSFGYDCQKRSNLHVLDENTIGYIAGNIVQLINLKTFEQTYLRSTSGGGVGSIAVHPNKTLLAVAEKGDVPNVAIYTYPELKLYRLLRGGTQKSYAYVDFSPDGELLASVGGEPDFMLTLWDWRQETTVLRSKAFSQDVFRVSFSTELEGQLTSSGIGHIRFWKMAHTFTGLKLQGQLGKFGKTEISDIEGYVELPDGKVLSGSENGNMLLWDGGLIKVEICRKNRKKCHHGTVQQIIMDEGELLTIGTDGYIRVWDFETIDTADAMDELGIFEMEPMNELKVDANVQLRSIVKSLHPDEPTMWIAQDASGGIWKLDLSFSFTSQAPEKLLSFHAGPIVGCAASPVAPFVCSIGSEGSVRVNDYVKNITLAEAQFSAAGCCILWAPCEVDADGTTIIAGFADGVVRVFSLTRKMARKGVEEHDLKLRQVFKPHKSAVTSIKADSHGKILSTGGEDGTVFFFTIEATYEPIGFVTVPSPVTHTEWAPKDFEDNTLLVACRDGHVVQIPAPVFGSYDTTKSYEIRGLQVKNYEFKSIKSRLRHEEEMAVKAKEEEIKRRKKEEERRIKIERGLEIEDEPEEEEDAIAAAEEQWTPFVPKEKSPVYCVTHSTESGRFWISMGSFDSGYLYEAEFREEKTGNLDTNEPLRAISTLDSNDTPVTTMNLTNDKKFIVMGMEDGAIRLQQIHNGDVGLMGAFWRLTMHDNNYGQITDLCVSFDQKYIISVGSDGNFFTFAMMEEKKIAASIENMGKALPLATEKEEIVDDIQDPKAYSIEDAKQKSEHDRMLLLAEEKKTAVRSMVSNLRDTFKTLINRNGDLPSYLQLDRQLFVLDPDIREELLIQTKDKIEVVKKEMAWEEEKYQVALKKLTTRFKDVVECERIVVFSFHGAHEVSSFRCSKLSEHFYMVKKEMEQRRQTTLSKGEASRQATQLSGAGVLVKEQSVATHTHDANALDATKVTTTLKGSMGERITKSLAKVEEKKRKRAVRKSQWDELLHNKPDEDFEDPLDVAAIKEAKENIGDYKLKSANDYVVPDHLRMNVEKARCRLLTLKDMIHQKKYQFNQKLLGLRTKKMDVISNIKSLLKKLYAIQENLSQEKLLPLPKVPIMRLEELPEKKYQFSQETLLKFKEEEGKKQAVANQGSSGFDNSQTFVSDTQSEADLEDGHFTPQNAPKKLSEFRFMEMRSLEGHIARSAEIYAEFEQKKLIQEINDSVANFDAELKCLRHEKFILETQLKNADLRHVTLFQELMLLKEFEKSENVLASKVDDKHRERIDMQNKVLDVQSKLETKKKDIEKLQEKERTLYQTFQTSLGENNKFSDYLTKVFKKKIKRTKKKANDGEGSDDESDNDSDDESDWSESEEESDSETGGYDLDVCPQGCDQQIYDNTCALREKRLDIEEALAEEKKNRENFNKEAESLQKKTKIIDNALRSAELELEAFQLEKQRKLNELDVVVTLRLNQIQYYHQATLPSDLSPCLVFEAPALDKLQQRIKELEHEKSLQKKQQKDAKKKHVQLIKDKRLFEDRIQDMNSTCNEMMTHKFGRLVNLEKLEQVTVNRNIEELKEKLRVTELKCSNELATLDEKNEEHRMQIAQLIRQNTKRLDQLNSLITHKKEFEHELNSRQKDLGGEFAGIRKADVEEKQRLVQLVHLQAQEIEALKEEIMLLSRKGGHILPPAQHPLAQNRGGSAK